MVYNPYNVNGVMLMLWGKLMEEDFEIDFYVRPDGTCPVKDFIDSLTIKMKAKIMREIKLLEIIGKDLREPHSKLLEDGIFELRMTTEGNITRILYFFVKGKRIVLTNGYTKKTQKTPRQVIQTAMMYRKNYLDSIR